MVKCSVLAGLVLGTHGSVVSSKGPSPIRKVITLIEEMKSQVEKEGSDDLKAYDEYKCWCATNGGEKKEAIAYATESIGELEAFLEEAAGHEGALKTQIASLATDIASDNTAIADASGVKDQETKAFEAEEADMKQSISLLAEAVTVITSAGQLQLDQRGKAVLLQVSHIMKGKKGNFDHFADIMQKDIYDVMSSFQGPSSGHHGAFLTSKAVKQPSGAAAGAKSYNGQSGSIVGLLAEMKDELERDLSSAQKNEFTALVNFQKLRAAKLAEIQATTEQKTMQEARLADLLDRAARADADLTNLKDARSADEKFVAELQQNCQVVDQEYAARQKIRGEELVALSETLSILTGDAARDLFADSVGTSFLQVNVYSDTSTDSKTDEELAAQDRLAEHAMERVSKMAKKHHDWTLLSLAVRIRLDPFAKVQQTMDKMLATLKKQQKEEYDKNEQCKSELDSTEDQIKVAKQQKEDLGEDNTDLTNTLATLNDQITTLKSEVNDMEISLKKAGIDRKAENELFQGSTADQRATVQILNMALDRLKKFYTPGGAVLLSVREHGKQPEPGAAAPPPPAKPKDFEKSAGAGGVLQLLSAVISDAEQEEVELQLDENQAQKMYAGFVAQSTASIEADRNSIAEKSKQVAETESSKSKTQESQISNTQDLENLDGILSGLHAECDFVTKYFDMRQNARAEEMDSIEDAKAILAGADFGK